MKVKLTLTKNIILDIDVTQNRDSSTSFSAGPTSKFENLDAAQLTLTQSEAFEYLARKNTQNAHINVNFKDMFDKDNNLFFDKLFPHTTHLHFVDCSQGLMERVIAYLAKKTKTLKHLVSLKFTNSKLTSNTLVPHLKLNSANPAFQHLDSVSFQKSKSFNNLTLKYFLLFDLSKLKKLDISL